MPVHGEFKDGIWTKKVRGSVHMLKRPESWAVDAADLADAIDHGIATIAIVDTETQKRYTVTAWLFDQKGIRINRGHGDQVALPLRYWQVEELVPA
jgi:hypothetical protein